MPDEQERGAPRPAVPDRRVEEGVVALQRSVAACQFYPGSHPSLAESLREGYQAWEAVQDDPRWAEPGLQLRSGGLWLGESRLGADNPAVASLVRILSGHGVVAARCTGRLSPEGFRELVELLATAPDLLRPGGAAGRWAKSAHAAAVELRTLQVAPAGELSEEGPPQASRGWGDRLPEAGQGALLADPRLMGRLQAFQQRSPRERRVVGLLLRLGRTDEISAFLGILREVTRLVEEYLEVERYREPFHVVLFLYREAQNMEALGREGKRDYLLDTVRLLVRGDFLRWLIEEVSAPQADGEAEIGEYVLRSLGKAAVVPLINALVMEKSRVGRRRLVGVLVSVGDSAVPWVTRMLEDQRWYVVRNMVTILGGIGSPECLRALLKVADDPDNRVRKEVARSLGRIRAPDATTRLIGYLRDPDPSVRLMAVTAVSSHRTEAVLRALRTLFREISLGSPEWNLKPAILQAVGRLGREEAVEWLAIIAHRRRWLRRDRWSAVREAALQALGDLGGDRAREVLESFRDDSQPGLRAAAFRALAGLGGDRR